MKSLDKKHTIIEQKLDDDPTGFLYFKLYKIYDDIKKEGKVGIGTTAPGETCDVVGVLSGSSVYSAGGHTGTHLVSGGQLVISGGLIIAIN